jgi:hypothetical protein
MKTATGPGSWIRVERGRDGDMLARLSGDPGLRTYQREVSDGHLTVFAGYETYPGWDAPKWHLSISHRTNEQPPKPGRYPTWDEIKDARYRFMPGNITAAMLLPPEDEFVNAHPTTFHLWQVPGEELPS